MNLIRLERDRFEDPSFMNVQGGYTSLHWACQKGHVEITDYLISAGANVESLDQVLTNKKFGILFFTV